MLLTAVETSLSAEMNKVIAGAWTPLQLITLFTSSRNRSSEMGHSVIGITVQVQLLI